MAIHLHDLFGEAAHRCARDALHADDDRAGLHLPLELLANVCEAGSSSFLGMNTIIVGPIPITSIMSTITMTMTIMRMITTITRI